MRTRFEHSLGVMLSSGEKKMNPQHRWQLRWSLLSELVAKAPGKLGRTAIMKLVYFLQSHEELARKVKEIKQKVHRRFH
jgi:hypothetical protein